MDYCFLDRHEDVPILRGQGAQPASPFPRCERALIAFVYPSSFPVSPFTSPVRIVWRFRVPMLPSHICPWRAFTRSLRESWERWTRNAPCSSCRRTPSLLVLARNLANHPRFRMGSCPGMEHLHNGNTALCTRVCVRTGRVQINLYVGYPAAPTRSALRVAGDWPVAILVNPRLPNPTHSQRSLAFTLTPGHYSMDILGHTMS